MDAGGFVDSTRLGRQHSQSAVDMKMGSISAVGIIITLLKNNILNLELATLDQIHLDLHVHIVIPLRLTVDRICHSFSVHVYTVEY